MGEMEGPKDIHCGCWVGVVRVTPIFPVDVGYVRWGLQKGDRGVEDGGGMGNQLRRWSHASLGFVCFGSPNIRIFVLSNLSLNRRQLRYRHRHCPLHHRRIASQTRNSTFLDRHDLHLR